MTVRALVVGSLVQDLSFRVPARPQPDEVVIATEFRQFRGGRGYNQAVALARLGAEVIMVGAVGADDHGDDFLRALTREGVDASRVVRMDGVSTSMAVPLITPDGAVAFVQYQGANRYLSSSHCVDLPDCDVLLLQGEIQAPVNLASAERVRTHVGRVILNPAPAGDIPPELLDAADVVIANRAEAATLLRWTGDVVDAGEAARALAAPGRAAVVTMGPDGAAWAEAGRSGHVAPPPVQAVDTTGAGAAFCAAVAVSTTEGADWPEAVAFACAAGAYASTVRGAEPALPRREDLARLLRR